MNENLNRFRKNLHLTITDLMLKEADRFNCQFFFVTLGLIHNQKKPLLIQ
jgi:hypothetical protein